MTINVSQCDLSFHLSVLEDLLSKMVKLAHRARIPLGLFLKIFDSVLVSQLFHLEIVGHAMQDFGIGGIHTIWALGIDQWCIGGVIVFMLLLLLLLVQVIVHFGGGASQGEFLSSGTGSLWLGSLGVTANCRCCGCRLCCSIDSVEDHFGFVDGWVDAVVLG